MRARPPARPLTMEPRETTLHGHRVSYREAGDGAEAIVLVHGITGSSRTWGQVMPRLAERYRVIAPDLLGHGASAKPRGDYSLGAYASGIRDLLVVLGVERATFVGHSLGGGVAMQLAYQFPERCDRLVLVSSGGLGREVSMLLRAAALPGSEYVLPFICGIGLASVGDAAAGVLGKLGLRAAPDIEEMWRGYASLADASARQAFVHTLRGIVDPGGQRVSAADRLYLATLVPTLVVWGDRDHVIPARHAHVVRGAVPGTRLEIFGGARHFPHRDDPDRFVSTLVDFMRTTAPADLEETGWREMLIAGA